MIPRFAELDRLIGEGLGDMPSGVYSLRELVKAKAKRRSAIQHVPWGVKKELQQARRQIYLDQAGRQESNY